MAQEPPGDRTPIVFKPETFARHDSAVRYVEGLIRTRAPRPDTGRFPGLAMGAWGLLASGGTISAGSGLSLGSGSVTLCTRDGSTLTDTGESVTVYNSGAAISAGGSSLAVAMEWTEAGWSACECGGKAECGNCCVPCPSPCQVPKADLTLSWTGTPPTYPPGSLVLRWTGTSWQGSGFFTPYTVRWTATCDPTGLKMTIVNPGVGTESCYPTTVTCNPSFHATYGCSPTGISLAFFGNFTLDGPAIDAGPVCCQGFSITGCNSHGVPDAIVSVYDSEGGTLLDTNTTVANGFTGTWWNGPCDVYVTVSDPSGRLTDYAGSFSLTAGATTTISLLPVQPGYTCDTACGLPLADTLHATFAVAGAHTFTASGDSWTSSFAASGNSYVATLVGSTGVLSITRNGSPCFLIGFVVNQCPPSFSAHINVPFGSCSSELGGATVTE